MNKRLAAWLLSVALFCFCSLSVVLPAVTAQDVEFVVAELGGVSVISIPQPSPLPGLLATKVVLRTDAENKLVTYEHIQLTGAVHQTFIPGVFGGPPTPTPFVDGIVWDFLPPEWIAADSHMLISPSMVQGEAGGGFTGISEVNDSGNPAGASELLPLLGGVTPALTGIGSIAMEQSTDAFFVAAEFQTNEIDLAYLVTPDDSTGAAGDVFLTVGVLGQGIIDSGQPGGASFGFNGIDPIAIPFIPVNPKPWITLATVNSPVQFGESVALSAITASSIDVAAVEFFANDEPVPSCSFTTQPYECEWTPSLPGSYDMTARATDVDGGVGNAPSWSLRVQGEPPLITIATESSSILEGNSLTLSADATAQMGEIATVLFFAHDLVIPDCRLTAAPYVCEWTPRSAGPYDVWARAIDSFGGVGDSERRPVLVESAAPSVALAANRTSVPRGYGVTLSANATARVGEIASVEFLSDGEPIPGCRLVTAPYECEWTADRAGAYNITARATDDSGRVGDSADSQLNVLAPFTWLSSEGVEVVFTPDPQPLLNGDLLGGTLSVESLDGSEVSSFGGISLRDLHHVGVQQLTGVGPTVTAADHRDPAHAQYDSHLLVTPEMIAGSVGDILQETGFDDPAVVDPAGVQNRIPADMFGNPAHTYRGDIVHGGGALSLRPEFQADTINVARLVGRPGDVSRIRFDVLGDFSSEGNFEFEIGWTQPVGNLPTIQFDAPALIQGGTSVTLSALANDSDGDLALVEFSDNGVPIPACTFSEGPYECAWKPTGGSHKLRATATDENGNRARSEAAQVFVEPPPEFVIAELGGVSVISIPQPSPLPGLLATKVVLRTDAENKLVTYENIQITGSVHQTFLPGAFGGPPQPSPFVDAVPFWSVAPPEWIAADSHLLISPSMVGGGAGAGFSGISETNDLSNPAGANESLPLIGGSALALTGIGDITMRQPTDAFFLAPEFQTNEIELAYVVTPDDATGAAGEVFITVGVLGEGIINSGQAGGASFGINGNDPVAIPFGSSKPLIALTTVPSPAVLGETINLSALATTSSGEIVSVEFFSNDELIPGCSFVALPYECVWAPSAVGSFNITARATDDLGGVGDSRGKQFTVLSPLTVSLSSPPQTGPVRRALLTGESLTLAADVVHALGEAIVSVEFLANDELIPGCSFTIEPYECEWAPDEDEYVVVARAEDAVGNRQDSLTGIVSVFPPGSGGIDDGLPRDADGNIIVAEEFHTPGAFGGPPIPLVFPGAPVDPLPLFVVLPTDEGGPVTLLAIEEIADEADMFAYAGDPPPLRFESREVRVGPFDVEPRGGGEFSAMYALAFDDGSRVVATISANVYIPEPGTFSGSIVCLMGLILYRRRKHYCVGKCRMD